MGARAQGPAGYIKGTGLDCSDPGAIEGGKWRSDVCSRQPLWPSMVGKESQGAGRLDGLTLGS